MAEQQALDATFFAFRKRDKMVLLPATVIMVVALIILVGVLLFMSRAAIGDYMAWITTMASKSAASYGGAAPEAMLPPASVMNLVPMWLIFQIVYYIVLAAWEAACLKWMIRGDDRGLFGLSFGADTWRVYFTYWLWLILLIVLYIACIAVGAGVAVGVAGVAMHGKPEASADAAGPTFLLVAALCLALLAAFVYVAVRFAPAAATSVAEKRFAFFDAWKVTKGRFWPLLGAFAILYLMFIVGYIVVSTALGMLIATTLMSSVGAMPASGEPSMGQVMAMLISPRVLAPMATFYVIIIVAAMTFCIALFGVNARAARAALEEGKITQAA